MPIRYLRQLSHRERSEHGNRHLARYLAFCAGAVNAGGFFAVKQYTSHMTGMTATIGNQMALGEYTLMLAAFGSVLWFIIGSGSSAMLINWSRRQNLQSEYAIPLAVEAAMLACFSLVGQTLANYDVLFVPITVSILCFNMGMQNAMITKLSRSEIRTTHVTGIVTDIGIELGKLIYWNKNKDANVQPFVQANRTKLWLLSSLMLVFLVGGIVGAFGFKYAGFISILPYAGMIGLLAIIPVIDDLMA